MKQPSLENVRPSYVGQSRGGSSRLPPARLFDIFEICQNQLGICEMIGRPETHPIKKIIGFTEEMIDAVETWRAKQKPVPNLSEAIRRLIELGLKAKQK